jgi:predicted MFS family arabinose efflux permease
VAGERALLVLACAAFALETSLYSSLVPLLPHYVSLFRLSKFAAGLLAASYALGAILGSIVGGWLVGRVGIRATTMLGFGFVVAASAGLGFAGTIAALDAARVGQGVGAGLIWAGVLTWAVASAGPERRGRTIGDAIAAAVFGTLVGPLVGTVAIATTPAVTFSGVAVVTAVTGAYIVASQPAGALGAGHHLPIPHSLRQGRLRTVVVTNLLPGAFIAVMYLLVPLRLARLGASNPAIGAAIAATAAVSIVMSRVMGRLSDRRDPLRLAVTGLVALSIAVLALPLAETPFLLATLLVAVAGVIGVVFIVPAITVLNQQAEAQGLAAGMAAALVNLCFSTGELIGAPAAAAMARLGSDLTAFAVLGATGLCVAVALARQAL